MAVLRRMCRGVYQAAPGTSLTFVWYDLEMILPAIGIFLVAYSEALGVAREFAEKHHYEVDPNQELNAHAITNLASGLFGGMIMPLVVCLLLRLRRGQEGELKSPILLPGV